MNKQLVTLEINLWSGAEISIQSREIDHEGEKTLFVPTVHYVRNRTSPMIHIGPFNKRNLDTVSSARPGTAKTHIVVDGGLSHKQIRQTPEYRAAVRRMLDKVHAELITAGTYMAQLEDSL